MRLSYKMIWSRSPEKENARFSTREPIGQSVVIWTWHPITMIRLSKRIWIFWIASRSKRKLLKSFPTVVRLTVGCDLIGPMRTHHSWRRLIGTIVDLLLFLYELGDFDHKKEKVYGGRELMTEEAEQASSLEQVLYSWQDLQKQSFRCSDALITIIWSKKSLRKWWSYATIFEKRYTHVPVKLIFRKLLIITAICAINFFELSLLAILGYQIIGASPESLCRSRIEGDNNPIGWARDPRGIDEDRQ